MVIQKEHERANVVTRREGEKEEDRKGKGRRKRRKATASTSSLLNRDSSRLLLATYSTTIR